MQIRTCQLTLVDNIFVNKVLFVDLYGDKMLFYVVAYQVTSYDGIL